ncbi:hypothetical protein [Microbacterium sp. gxy059]|uniref:hypothetical protein n=1 Tax=Microbacterium sp. gxy059 TaxID=2957199 RepID=UPI003D979E88
MDAPEQLYPPAQYGGGWILLALAVLAVIAGGAWLLWALTRPPRPEDLRDATPPPLPVGAALERLRDDHLAQIQGIEDAWRRGEITARQAHYDLSRVTRAFVNAYTGLETPVLSLDELAARGVHPALLDALERHYYPSLFRDDVVIDPAAGADAARRVVTAWH